MMHSLRKAWQGAVSALYAIKLAFSNPKVFIYLLLPTILGYTLLDHYTVKATLELLNIFLSISIAHYSMHLLKYKTASLSLSFKKSFAKIGSILLLVLIFVGTNLIAGLLLRTILLIPVALFIGAAIIFSIPIIATEPLNPLQSFKRSVRIAWENLAAFNSTFLITSALIYLPLFIVPWVLKWPWLTTVFMSCSIDLIFFSTLILTAIADTLGIVIITRFYYQFYIKRELELAEIFATRM